MILCPLRGRCRVTQRFGERPEVYVRFGLKGHNGTDFAGPVPGVLLPLYAPYDGIITEVGNQGKDGYGKFFRMRTPPNHNGSRREIIMAHLSIVSVKLNQWVNLGDCVGIMGSTGFSSAPHCHVGLRRIGSDGKIINENNGFSGYERVDDFFLSWDGL